MADGQGGLVTVDITDPTDPVIKTIIIDNSDPSAPVTATSLDVNGYAENVMIGGTGSVVYVSAKDHGIVTVDTTDPAAPVIDSAWSYDTAGNCRDTACYTDGYEIYILAADSGDGVVVINPTYDYVPDGDDIDNDEDGYTENQGDYDDNDDSIYPGATEICGDGIDQDCDGLDQACSGICDMNGDGRMDLKDIIYGLQVLAGVR